MRNLLSTAAALALCGCISTQPKQVSAQFDEAEHARAMAPGNCSIKGQAFMLTAGGEVRLGAGRTVTLYPATAYSLEVWRNAGAGGVSNHDPRWKAGLRRTTVDAQGNFEFSGLQPGRWLLDCSITWQIPTGAFTSTTGGVVRGDVTLVDGQAAQIILR